MKNTSTFGTINWAIKVASTHYNRTISVKAWRLRKCDINLQAWAKQNLSEAKPYIIATSSEIADIYESCGCTKLANMSRLSKDTRKLIWSLDSSSLTGRTNLRFIPIR